MVNETLAEGTPFAVTTEVLGGGKCVQTIRRRANPVIPSDHFVRYYNEVFKALEQRGLDHLAQQ